MSRPAWLDLLTYVSVAAVVVALSRNDLLRVPVIESGVAAAGSMAALLIGFVASVLAWQAALRDSGLRISLADAVTSAGLSVFGKYLPGKVWLILGMAGRIARHHPVELRDVVAVATRMQVLSLLVGLIVGMPALALLEVRAWPIALAIALVCAGCAVLAVARLRNAVQTLAPILARVFAYLWPVSAPAGPALFGWLALTWLAWGLGFALLGQALSGEPWPWPMLAVFPLAAVLGLLVLIAPGGIGAREGVLALALAALGMDAEQIVSVSIWSRAWFLLGELSLFVAGLLALKCRPRAR